MLHLVAEPEAPARSGARGSAERVPEDAFPPAVVAYEHLRPLEAIECPEAQGDAGHEEVGTARFDTRDQSALGDSHRRKVAEASLEGGA